MIVKNLRLILEIIYFLDFPPYLRANFSRFRKCPTASSKCVLTFLTSGFYAYKLLNF